MELTSRHLATAPWKMVQVSHLTTQATTAASTNLLGFRLNVIGEGVVAVGLAPPSLPSPATVVVPPVQFLTSLPNNTASPFSINTA